MTFAVLRPTPGIDWSGVIVCGTPPPKTATIAGPNSLYRQRVQNPPGAEPPLPGHAHAEFVIGDAGGAVRVGSDRNRDAVVAGAAGETPVKFHPVGIRVNLQRHARGRRFLDDGI